MKRFYRIIVVVLLLLHFASLGTTQEVPVFQQNPDAQRLAELYEKAASREREMAAAKIAEIEMSLADSLKELKDTLISELKKLQDKETKAGNLDAAVEVRDAVKNLENEPNIEKELTSMEVRENLVGSVWEFGPTEAVPSPKNWVRLNADGTVTAGWHEQPSMWAVLPNSSVQMIFQLGRDVHVMKLNADLTLAQFENGSVYRRRK